MVVTTKRLRNRSMEEGVTTTSGNLNTVDNDDNFIPGSLSNNPIVGDFENDFDNSLIPVDKNSNDTTRNALVSEQESIEDESGNGNETIEETKDLDSNNEYDDEVNDETGEGTEEETYGDEDGEIDQVEDSNNNNKIPIEDYVDEESNENGEATVNTVDMKKSDENDTVDPTNNEKVGDYNNDDDSNNKNNNINDADLVGKGSKLKNDALDDLPVGLDTNDKQSSPNQLPKTPLDDTDNDDTIQIPSGGGTTIEENENDLTPTNNKLPNAKDNNTISNNDDDQGDVTVQQQKPSIAQEKINVNVNNDVPPVVGPKQFQQPTYTNKNKPILKPSFNATFPNKLSSRRNSTTTPYKNSKNHAIDTGTDIVGVDAGSSSGYTLVIIGFAIMIVAIFICLYRYCCRSNDDTAGRGQYRQVAAHYTANAFDDTFDDNVSYEDLDADYDQDDFDDNNYNNNHDKFFTPTTTTTNNNNTNGGYNSKNNNSNGFTSNNSHNNTKKKRGVIEMKELESDINERNGGLSLAEMNG